MKRHITVLLTSLIALPGLALAGDCGVTSVSALLGTTCSVGNLTFSFTGYSANGGDASEYAAAAVTFTPETGGFNLSGVFSSSSNTISYGGGQLFYSVSVADGTVVGVTTNLNGASSAASNPGGNIFSQGVAGSVNQFYNNSQYAEAHSQQCTLDSNGTTHDCSQNHSPVPVSPPLPSGSDESDFFTEAYSYNSDTGTYSGGTASGSFTSADFQFQTTSVPEPSAWLSLATLGVLLILPMRRLRRRGTR